MVCQLPGAGYYLKQWPLEISIKFVTRYNPFHWKNIFDNAEGHIDGWCKTVVTPLLTYCSYCSLALIHRYVALFLQFSMCWKDMPTSNGISGFAFPWKHLRGVTQYQDHDRPTQGIPIQGQQPYLIKGNFLIDYINISYCGRCNTITDFQSFCQNLLTHWDRDKMGAIFQTAFWNAFSWMKMCEFWLKFYWSLFLRVQLTISSIGSHNGLESTRRQAIIWTNGG